DHDRAVPHGGPGRFEQCDRCVGGAVRERAIGLTGTPSNASYRQTQSPYVTTGLQLRMALTLRLKQRVNANCLRCSRLRPPAVAIFAGRDAKIRRPFDT